MRGFILLAALSLTACAATPAPIPEAVDTPYRIAAGDDVLAQRATASNDVVSEVYHWVHTNEYPNIESRLRAEIPNTTRRLYNPEDGVRVKYIGRENVYSWSANSGQVKRGTWEIKDSKFGPQICETFYGAVTCLNTVEQLSGVGMIDSRAGDVFGLAAGGRPVAGEDGLPGWEN